MLEIEIDGEPYRLYKESSKNNYHYESSIIIREKCAFEYDVPEDWTTPSLNDILIAKEDMNREFESFIPNYQTHDGIDQTIRILKVAEKELSNEW